MMNFTENSYCGSGGIENESGEDGLSIIPFCETPPSNQAILISRPDPSARVRVSPPYQSQFISPGESIQFAIDVANLGNLGEDTFSMDANSDWSFQLLDSDQITPLQDTNDDGVIDSGPLLENQSTEVYLALKAPENLPTGTETEITITVTSSLDPGTSQSVNIQAAVPSRFVQVFRDDANGAMGMLFSDPQRTSIQLATENGQWGYNPTVVEMAAGNYLYLWERYRYLENSDTIVSELEYVLLDYNGVPLSPVKRLTDHTNALNETYDQEPVVAVSPDGSVGVAWRHRVLRETLQGMQENWNVYFAILNPQGELVRTPMNITQNDGWFKDKASSIGVPRYWNTRIAANPDNQFALTWHKETSENPTDTCLENCSLNEIYFSLWSASGNPIKTNTRFTNSIVSEKKAYASPTVTSLSNQRWLFAYNHSDGGMAFLIVDTQGNVIRERSFIDGTGFGWATTAVQPINSHRIVLAWTGWSANNPQIHVVFLDSDTYQKIRGPFILTNPAATTGGDYPSLTFDSRGQVIATWMDYNSNARVNLYYALFTKNGDLVTSPMIFYSAIKDEENNSHIEAGFTSYSNTFNRQFLDVPVNYWSAVWIERLYDAGITVGCSINPPTYCAEENLTRAEMAVLLGRQIHGTQEPPNNSDPNLGQIFADVSDDYWAAAWIEQLYADGITRGCSQDPLLFCPNEKITRDEMAVFLVRLLHGNDSLIPEPTGDVFADVPSNYWAAAEIEQLYRDGITTGCGTNPLRFCPFNETTRAEIAAFLVRTFNLP